MSPADDQPRRVLLAVVLLAAALLGYFVAVPRDFYTGTNSVRTRGMLVELTAAGQLLCLPGIAVPAGTGRMEVEVDTNASPLAPMRLTLTAGEIERRATLPPGPPGRRKVAFAFAPLTERGPPVEARACIRRTGVGGLFFGGVPTIAPGQVPPEVDGTPVGTSVAVWWRPPAGERASILSRLPDLMQRIALFRPSWVGPLTYWIIFLGLAPGLVALALRLLLRAPRPSRMPLALAVALIAFGNAAVWAHVTDAFDAPDETEHFAYVQSLAERGKPLEAAPSDRSPYSSAQALGIQATRILDRNETRDGKPPWLDRQEAAYERLDDGLPRNDGGGFATAGSVHSPLYYALALPGYHAASGGGLWNQLTASRLTSAVLGALIAALAVLLVLELAPGRRRLAAAAGVALAFHPMFAFMSGAVNNDMGVNAAAALVTFLLVRLLRRGPAMGLAVGLGAALAALPIFKATGFALYPAAVLALVLATWRHRRAWRPGLAAGAALVAAFAVVYGAWAEVSGRLDRGALTTPGGRVPGEGFLALQQPGGALSYVWEIFFPRLPFMAEHWTQPWPAFDIYGLRGWGAFGWYALPWDYGVYWAIMVLMVALAVAGLVALAVRREWTRRSLPEVLVLAAIVLGVIGVMNAAYYSVTPQGDSYPQQGRYIFPAVTALAAMFVGATAVVRRRAVSDALAAGLAAAVVCLGYASLWLVLGGFYHAAA